MPPAPLLRGRLGAAPASGDVPKSPDLIWLRWKDRVNAVTSRYELVGRLTIPPPAEDFEAGLF